MLEYIRQSFFLQLYAKINKTINKNGIRMGQEIPMFKQFIYDKGKYIAMPCFIWGFFNIKLFCMCKEVSQRNVKPNF